MAANLVDSLVKEQREAGEILAGCASVAPKEILGLLENFDLEKAISPDAVKYLKALVAKKQEIDQADADQAIEISVRTAFELGIHDQVCRWQILTLRDDMPPALELAENKLRRITHLVIANRVNSEMVGKNGTDPAKPGQAERRQAPPEPELADRWITKNPNTAFGQGEFRRYDHGIWPVLNIDEVRAEFQELLEEAMGEGVRPTSRMVNSVMEYARVKIRVADDVWDADPNILVCQNGTLHIPTRQLLPHNPANYATYSLPFDYDPEARADVWDFVLNSCVFEAKEFLQEYAGLCLTPITKYEIALWLYSPPGGGKSTILAGFQSMLGERSGLLGLADIEQSRFALTNLPGKTLMVSAEQPGGYMVATHYLNAIISGEPITVDRKFKDPITLFPRAKLVWAMNELPRVGEAGSGLFRRVKVLQMPTIPEKDRDPEIKERVKEEGAGILNWALDGLDRLRRRGFFEIPSCVQDATRHFRETNDVPAIFVEEKCLKGDELSSQGSLLYAAYKDWCIENGHKPKSNTSVAEDWRRMGFEKYLANGKSFWRGIGLKVDSVDTRTLFK